MHSAAFHIFGRALGGGSCGTEQRRAEVAQHDTARDGKPAVFGPALGACSSGLWNRRLLMARSCVVADAGDSAVRIGLGCMACARGYSRHASCKPHQYQPTFVSYAHRMLPEDQVTLTPYVLATVDSQTEVIHIYSVAPRTCLRRRAKGMIGLSACLIFLLISNLTSSCDRIPPVHCNSLLGHARNYPVACIA